MKINAAIQLLPLITTEEKYLIIDKAIELVNKSGLIYKVCPYQNSFFFHLIYNVFKIVNYILIQMQIIIKNCIKFLSLIISDKYFLLNSHLQFIAFFLSIYYYNSKRFFYVN